MTRGTEAEMTLNGCRQLDVNAVRAYVEDLRNLLDEGEVAQRKAFLRSFIKKIIVVKDMVKYITISWYIRTVRR